MEVCNQTTKELFDRRVIIKSLIVTDQPATRPETRARISSPKGELAVLSDEDSNIRHLAYVELKPGMTRGDHYHKIRNEWFYLISGEVMGHFERVGTPERESVKLVAGDLLLILPGIAHAFVPLTPGHGIEFAAETFDLSDVYRHPIAPEGTKS